MTARILFVEDEDGLRNVLLEAASLDGHQAEGVATAEAALERLFDEAFDIVVTDITLGAGMSGLDLLQHLPRLCPGVVPIVITAYGTIDVAVEAMKRGASDFVTKPFDIKTLSSVIRVAAERAAITRHRLSVAASDHSEQDGGALPTSSNIVAASSVMRKLLEQVKAIAPFNITVLVTGETGTGKELIARAIHEQSSRKDRRLISLNCAAVPEQLLEDELFGHVKGAFTGAHSAREGRFEQADGGTLFLDEIGDMSLPLQSKLLRVLQEREFEKLGSSYTIKVDVRIVAATSANLERRIAEGSFRSDLYYRLNVVHLRLAPLRERADDIEPLAEHLLERFCVSAELPPKKIDDEARGALKSYHWPGNVRQLQNAMERAAALTGTQATINLCDLPEEARSNAASTNIRPAPEAAEVAHAALAKQEIPDGGVNFDAVMANVERELLQQSLDKTSGNKLRAAKLLNMKRTTFVEKLKRLQIEDDDLADTEADASASECL